MNNNSINPYELLGFDSKYPNLITLSQLKKTYYTLSLICHPDKGGNPDDMIILKNSYQYIKNQIEHKDSKPHNYELVEEEFKNFMKEQSNKPPPFSSIYEEAHEWLLDFNEQFIQNKLQAKQEYKNKHSNENDFQLYDNESENENLKKIFSENILEDGYGHLMDLTESTDRDEEIKKDVTHHFVKDITFYKEPTSYQTSFTDYMEAFTENNTITSIETIKIENNNSDIEYNLEKIIKERQDFENNYKPETGVKLFF
jgi:curved DNA-binding protein CbpA